jgi:hypothetical protein
MFGFLKRERTVAGPGFSRWMVPPAALCIHLCIGQVYALSVFNLPMTKLIGVAESSSSDWLLTEIGWMYTLAIVFSRIIRGIFWSLGRGGRSTPSYVYRRSVLVGWFSCLGIGRVSS